MPKLTLLEMAQNILSDMDSDEVNSINDTVEALQVAEILKTTYFEIINQRDWAHMATLFQLTASGDSTKPTHMSLSDAISKVEWVKYNKIESGGTRAKWDEVEYLTPEEFIARVTSRDSSLSTVTTVTEQSIPLYVYNDRAPEYYTTFDDETLIFDAHDNTVDTTLQTSKTQCWGYKEPTWSMVDGAIPDLPTKAFPFMLAEAKSAAFNSLKQFPNQKEEQKSRRQRYKLSRDHRRNEGRGVTFPDYGRDSNK
jgi:hypothetical protein